MKRLTITILVALHISLFSPPADSLLVQDSTPAPIISAQDLNNFQQEDAGEFGDEDDIFFYEQESFSRKLFQRKLTPLSKREKIIWAFRMSEPDLFL